MTWRVAYSLDTLLAEINTAAPKRDKAADGSIGDAAHSARASDHNPNVYGAVRARDFTHDPAGGLDCDDLAAHLWGRLGRHPALGSGAYIIWQRRIVSTDRLAEGWRAYTGSNPHDHHLHLSVATSPSGYDSRAPFGWPPKVVSPLRKALTRAIRQAKKAGRMPMVRRLRKERGRVR